MELCSASESSLVNNNDLKQIHNEESGENSECIAGDSKNEAKAIDAKRSSTTDEDSDINCSIVQDQASSTEDSSIKITFKLQKKDQLKKKMPKNKTKSKPNCNSTSEKVGKLIIKDSHGEYSIKSSDKEAQNDMSRVENEDMNREDGENIPEGPSTKKGTLVKDLKLKDKYCDSSNLQLDPENENTKKCTLDSGGGSQADDKKETTSLNNTSVVEVPVISQESAYTKTKRKSDLEPCNEFLNEKNEKTDIEDCNEEIPLIKRRRKLSETISENSKTEVIETSKDLVHNATQDIQSSINKRELNTSDNEAEPKAKKLKTKSCESPDARVKDMLNEIESCTEDVKENTLLSQISIEIPENESKTISNNNEIKSKSEEKSPTQKSPKNAKKITLDDFLKELNEESKNIKEGDEIPDSDDHEMSEDVGCVIVKEKGDNEENKKESDLPRINESETNKMDVIKSELSESDNDMPNNEGPSEIVNSKSDKNCDSGELKTDNDLKEVENGKKVPSKRGRKLKKVISNDESSSYGAISNERENDQVQNDDEDVHSDVKKDGNMELDELKSSSSNDKVEKEPIEKEKDLSDGEEKATNKLTDDTSKPESSKEEVNKSVDNKSSDESDSSENSSDESSSSASDSSDSDSSDTESGSESSDSDSTDTEKKKEPEKTIVHPKKLKIRNAPSLSQDSLQRSDSSSSAQDSAEKSHKIEESDKPAVKSAETLSQQILAGSTGTGTTPIVKKKRGRPRKYPLPEAVVKTEVDVTGESAPDVVESVAEEVIVGTVGEVTVDTEENTVVSIVNMDGEIPKIPKKRGRKPGFKVAKKPGRKKKMKKPKPKTKKHYEEYKKQKQLEALQTKLEEDELISSTPLVPIDTPPVKRKRGRPKKIKDPEPSTSDGNNSNHHVFTDALSEQLLELNSHLNKIVSDIPGISPVDDQMSNEITDNRLLEEINSGIDVITEEIVSEDVSNYIQNPLDEILLQEPKKEIKVEDDDIPYDDYDNYNAYDRPKKKVGRPPKHAKRLKTTEDPTYHKRYYKYVKIPKDQQKKRGPKKRVDVEVKVEKRRLNPGKRGRPRKKDLGAVERREERQDDDDNPWDESLSKELESVNRSMENILTEQDNDDKDFTVGHLKFEQLSEDQLKRSNRPKKDAGFSDFDSQIDELIEMAANEVQDRPKPKYRYYERIPKHLQKKRGRPKKIEDPNAPPRPPKPKKEKPPKPKKTMMVKKMVTDPETGEEKEIEVEEEVEDNVNDYIDFDEEDEYEEDIDDEDKDKDFNIGDYLKKGKNGIDNNLEYEEVYPTKEKLFKPKKTLKNYRTLKAHHAASRFNRFGKFGNKIRSMMPTQRRYMNACDFRYVTVYDADFEPIAKVQRMYCIKVAPATYDIAEKYKPRIKCRNLDDDDVSEFFEKYWCELCEISFLDTKINKRRHEYIFHTEEVECDLCDRTVSNRFNLRKHREIFHQKRVYTCRVCKEEFKKFRSFQMHVWMTHPEVTGKNKAYFCNICQVVFYRRASFKFHYFEHLNGHIFEQFDTSLSDIEFLLKQLMY